MDITHLWCVIPYSPAAVNKSKNAASVLLDATGTDSPTAEFKTPQKPRRCWCNATSDGSMDDCFGDLCSDSGSCLEPPPHVRRAVATFQAYNKAMLSLL